jgi:hypothetical protein
LFFLFLKFDYGRNPGRAISKKRNDDQSPFLMTAQEREEWQVRMQAKARA